MQFSDSTLSKSNVNSPEFEHPNVDLKLATFTDDNPYSWIPDMKTKPSLEVYSILGEKPWTATKVAEIESKLNSKLRQSSELREIGKALAYTGIVTTIVFVFNPAFQVPLIFISAGIACSAMMKHFFIPRIQKQQALLDLAQKSVDFNEGNYPF
jgi:hypothetical protein